MPSIYDLDQPLVEEILVTHCDPLDVSALARTGRAFHKLVYEPPDDHLWRSLYLAQDLDDPRSCFSHDGRPRKDIRWRKELQQIIRARTVLTKPGLSEQVSKGERCKVLRTLLDLVSYVPPVPVPPYLSESISRNLLWVAVVVRHSSILDYPVDTPSYTISDPQVHSDDDEELQLRCRLHTYFGLTRQDFLPSHRLASRAYAYMFRRYRFVNNFGPYMLDDSGRVNWVHVRALHHLLSLQVVDFDGDPPNDGPNFEFLIYPMSMSYTQLIMPEGVDFDEVEDWAGLEGTWHISFCFVDHRRLMEYNILEDVPEDTALDYSVFTRGGFAEIFRTIEVEIRITSTAPSAHFPNRPKLNFAGTVNNNYTITGHVEMTKPPSSASASGGTGEKAEGAKEEEQGEEEDEWGSGEQGAIIKWHFVSGEHGRAVWSSEGIQIGGLRSSFGVLGAWTTVFHDEDDPVGPFWMRKVDGSAVVDSVNMFI